MSIFKVVIIKVGSLTSLVFFTVNLTFSIKMPHYYNVKLRNIILLSKSQISLTTSRKNSFFFAVSFSSPYIYLFFPMFLFLFSYFYFYFILLYNTVLVLPYIDMNLPQVYMSSMEYYSAIKNNRFESALMRSRKLELIIQSEVSQKEKPQYSILTHIYEI